MGMVLIRRCARSWSARPRERSDLLDPRPDRGRTPRPRVPRPPRTRGRRSLVRASRTAARGTSRCVPRGGPVSRGGWPLLPGPRGTNPLACSGYTSSAPPLSDSQGVRKRKSPPPLDPVVRTGDAAPTWAETGSKAACGANLSSFRRGPAHLLRSRLPRRFRHVEGPDARSASRWWHSSRCSALRKHGLRAGDRLAGHDAQEDPRRSCPDPLGTSAWPSKDRACGGQRSRMRRRDHLRRFSRTRSQAR